MAISTLSPQKKKFLGCYYDMLLNNFRIFFRLKVEAIKLLVSPLIIIHGSAEGDGE